MGPKPMLVLLETDIVHESMAMARRRSLIPPESIFTGFFQTAWLLLFFLRVSVPERSDLIPNQITCRRAPSQRSF